MNVKPLIALAMIFISMPKNYSMMNHTLNKAGKTTITQKMLPVISKTGISKRTYIRRAASFGKDGKYIHFLGDVHLPRLLTHYKQRKAVFDFANTVKQNNQTVHFITEDRAALLSFIYKDLSMNLMNITKRALHQGFMATNAECRINPESETLQDVLRTNNLLLEQIKRYSDIRIIPDEHNQLFNGTYNHFTQQIEKHKQQCLQSLPERALYQHAQTRLRPLTWQEMVIFISNASNGFFCTSVLSPSLTPIYLLGIACLGLRKLHKTKNTVLTYKENKIFQKNRRE